ncbi:unnamed protein product [Arabidopsis halleri]
MINLLHPNAQRFLIGDLTSSPSFRAIWSFWFEIFRAILGISVFVSVGRWRRRFYREQ